MWKTVRQLSDLEGYVRCAVIYVRLLSKHYSVRDVTAAAAAAAAAHARVPQEREVLILLRDFAKRVAPVKNDPHLLEPLRPHLEAMVQGVVESTTEFGAVLTSEPFLGVMDMFEVRARGLRPTSAAVATAGATGAAAAAAAAATACPL